MVFKIITILKKVDAFVSRCIGVGLPSSYGYEIPQASTESELRAKFIKMYFSSQPSFLRLVLSKAYTLSKRVAFRSIRKAFGLMTKVAGRVA